MDIVGRVVAMWSFLSVTEVVRNKTLRLGRQPSPYRACIANLRT